MPTPPYDVRHSTRASVVAVGVGVEAVLSTPQPPVMSMGAEPMLLRLPSVCTHTHVVVPCVSRVLKIDVLPSTVQRPPRKRAPLIVTTSCYTRGRGSTSELGSAQNKPIAVPNGVLTQIKVLGISPLLHGRQR